MLLWSSSIGTLCLLRPRFCYVLGAGSGLAIGREDSDETGSEPDEQSWLRKSILSFVQAKMAEANVQHVGLPGILSDLSVLAIRRRHFAQTKAQAERATSPTSSLSRRWTLIPPPEACSLRLQLLSSCEFWKACLPQTPAI